MPFADYHVEEAVRYFTQNDPSGRLSGVAWEWAFQDSIVQQNQCCYTRSWAPELVWEDRVLEQDVVVYDLRPKLVSLACHVARLFFFAYRDMCCRLLLVSPSLGRMGLPAPWSRM